MLEEVDGKKIGELINELSELIRKLHTGSALIGEPGLPKFPKDLSRLLKEILENIDIESFYKARSLLTDGRESFNNILIDIYRNNPDFFIHLISHNSALINSRIRLKSRKAQLLADISDNEISSAIEKDLSEIEVQEIGEIINILCETIIRVKKSKPEITTSILNQLLSSIDIDLLRETLEIVVDDIVETVKPYSNEIMTPIIQGLCQLLSTDNEDGNSEELKQAVKSLGALLNIKGNS